MGRQGPERQYTTRLLGELRKLPHSWWYKVGAGPWQTPGIPDIIGSLRGRFVAIEVKVCGNQLTEKQAACLAGMQNAYVLTVLIYTDVDPAEAVKRIVKGE